MNSLFMGISPKYKEKLLYTLEAHSFTFAKNSKILNAINGDNIIGYIEKGYAQIIRTDYNGNVTIIEDLEKDAVFGSLLSSLNNSEYEIIAKEDTKVVVIDYNMLINHEEKESYYNQFIKNLFLIMSNKIDEKNKRIEIITKKSIRDKLLEYFKIISQNNGSKIIYLPFNYTELASFLAVDRSAMSREIKNLKEEGFIKTENKKITLQY